MKKLEISEGSRTEIYNKYCSGISMNKIVNDSGYSFTVVQKLINSFDYENQLKTNYPQKDGYYIIAVCNQTQKEISDYKNESGAITEHIFRLYSEEAKNSKYIRKSKEYKTGKFWYDQYFTFKYERIREVKKCYYCDWTTEDINNLSGAYEKHLLLIHNKTIENYLIDNITDATYFKHLTPDDAITCAICGEKLRILNDKHLSRHNITVDNYKLKYSDLIVSPSTHIKLSSSVKITNQNMTFSKTSKGENEVKDFLFNNGVIVKQSTRKLLDGIEIDLFLPDYNIGIEYNGNLYHTENYGKKGFNYHLNKTKVATDKKIKLFHIFEDEWHLRNEIVKNKLLHILNKNYSTKLHARKCNITEINKDIKSKFLEKYHIQGDDRSNYFLGAYYNETLIAVMSFNNNRNLNKEKNHSDDTYELTRYCTNSDYIINGIASKLLKFFILNKKPKKIISFADRRWTPLFNNNLYTNLGFDLTKILKPDYTYFNKKAHRSKRLHKFGFGKNAIKKRFPEIYNENKTEWEMMQELGYDRIWDCGKFKYELNL
jgi:hypothetical protein